MFGEKPKTQNTSSKKTVSCELCFIQASFKQAAIFWIVFRLKPPLFSFSHPSGFIVKNNQLFLGFFSINLH